jgi:transcription antitermination factor NusG
MQSSSKSWYVVYTRPKWEKKVAEQLAKKKIESYCPLKDGGQWNDRKKNVSEPLFTSYVFVRLHENEQPLVGQVDGVNNFLFWLGKPAVIRNEEIDEIKKFLNDFSVVHLEKTHVNLNDRVRILGGPLMVREGNVMEVRSSTFRVTLPSLGYTLVAETRRENVERISHQSKLQAFVNKF